MEAREQKQFILLLPMKLHMVGAAVPLFMIDVEMAAINTVLEDPRVAEMETLQEKTGLII